MSKTTQDLENSIRDLEATLSLDKIRLRKLKEQQALLEDLLCISTEKGKQSKDVSLEINKIKHILCPILITISEDTFTIANTVAQILIPLAIAGSLSVPITPVLIASVALTISRLGVTAFCADSNGNTS